ncbi:hypothetical protein NIIDMKKI_30130 [Mycobacterium kansasii]|uniref:Uncharacterized protein n=1 Tax=Mycobacterium kansasii TaxID=1768 RepID=A0A7G1IA62_MYCKA|nr:hypothetical protein NIIDMKKI_30130 [Mycobacterium kansasii]
MRTAPLIFTLNGGRVYVGAASTDAISWIGESGSAVPNWVNNALGTPLGPLAGLGTDPAHEGFGSVRFRAEVAGSHNVTPGSTTIRTTTTRAARRCTT